MNDTVLLQQENLRLQEELEAWKHKYYAMLEQFKLSQQRQYAASSEKNLLQQDLFDEVGSYEEETREQDQSEVIDVPTHQRTQPKRKPLPAHFPREEVIHDVEENQKICNCGCQKERFGEEVTEQLNIVPPKFSVIRHIRPKYACKRCELGVAIAPIPNLLLPKSMASPSLVAFTLINKYCDHIPLYRQESIWARYGIELPRNTLCGWLLSVADLCEPLWELLRKQVLSDDYCQTDETRVQVMNEPGRKNTQQSYVWVYRGGGKKQKVVVYDYQETRSGQHARDFLQGFMGYLQTDGYKGYDWADDIETIVHLGCMAHARRPFAELVKMLKKPGKAHQAFAFIQKLYLIEKKARDNGLSPKNRKQLRLKESVPILNKLKAWLEKTVRGSPPQGKLGKGIQYMLDRWDELTNYLKDGRLEIDNNFIENDIRPFALGRKNWLFMGSPRGARAGVVFYSLMMTCKANDIDPFAYFNYMLEHLRECKNSEDYEALLPFNIQVDLLAK